MKLSDKELEEIYEKEWKPSIKNSDGTLNEEKVKETLKNFSRLQCISSNINEEITGGLLSKSGYSSETVLSIYHQRQSQYINKKDACEDIINILKNILGNTMDSNFEEVIKEYFDYEDK